MKKVTVTGYGYDEHYGKIDVSGDYELVSRSEDGHSVTFRTINGSSHTLVVGARHKGVALEDPSYRVEVPGLSLSQSSGIEKPRIVNIYFDGVFIAMTGNYIEDDEEISIDVIP